MSSTVFTREEQLTRSRAKADGVLVGLSFAHAAVLILLPSAVTVALGVWWNSNTVSHHFLHVPFFRSRVWNRAYSLYLSSLLGIPQTYWRARHLAHHSGYVMNLRVTPMLVAETIAIISVWSILFAVVPQFFLYAYLPGYLAGLCLCYMHGYYEHARGTTSHYGTLYNKTFFNDGYHIEHHLRPGEHWTRLPEIAVGDSGVTSRWPPVLRWIEVFSIESMERVALRFRPLQRFLLRTHERALRRLLPKLPPIGSVKIVGGGMFPRSALLLQRLLPGAEITIVDASADHLAIAREYLHGPIRFLHRYYTPGSIETDDLLIIPLSFKGDRQELYLRPPVSALLVHDWIWSKRGHSAVVSWFLLKRMNLIVR